MTYFQHRVAFMFGLVLLGNACPSLAKEIQVQMRNRGAQGAMVFEPSFVQASPGDIVKFVATDASHNAESIPDMMPQGSIPFKGAMNKPIAFKVAKPGLYGVKCAPHYGMGMVALIQVGKVSPADLAAARAVKLPPLAAKRMAAAFALVK